MVAKAKALAVWALGNAGCAAGVTPKSLGRGRAMAYLSPNAMAVVMMKTSAKASEATHNTTLENYLAGAKNVSYADKNLTYKAWEVMWTNSTSVRLEDTFQNKSTNVTFNEVATYTIFPATQAATDYVNAMNKTTYSLASTVNSTATGYQKVTGHLPVVYKAYQWNEGNPLNISEYKAHFIAQFDNLVKIATIKALSVG